MTHKAARALATAALVLIPALFGPIASADDVDRSFPPQGPQALLNHETALPNAVTYNMCGGGCSGSGTQKANELADEVLTAPTRPLSIATQEQCLGGSTAWTTLNTRLVSGAGYTRHGFSVDNTGCGGNGYGNGIFWAGACYGSGGTSCRSGNFFSAQNGSGNPLAQWRGYACGRGLLPSHVACSAHMDQLDDGVAWDQAQEYENIVSFLHAFGPATNGSGDFNFEPVWMDFYAAWTEADSCALSCGNRDTHENGTKIDYSFSSVCRVHNSNIVGMSYSDHHLVRAYFNQC